MARPMRRVVTGHNAQGKSVILIDVPSPHALELDGLPGVALINLWATDRAPASNAGVADAAARPVVLEPPELGTIFRVVDFPLDKRMAGKVDRAKAFAAMGAGHAMDRSDARYPAMHKTNTVDYALVLVGEIWALMDEGETLLEAGDCLIQRGTNHAWSNRTDTPCRARPL
ncbi:MAG TPA: cupin domain-containing protein [Methylomirabilota bacterium]|nr:cupin domain-containing protein [Methylomirabilota bacterium]